MHLRPQLGCSRTALSRPALSPTAILCAMLLLPASALLGCRGEKSAEPPVHLNLNMDFQSKFVPQSENAFFKDKRASRLPVTGTIARGDLQEDDHLHRGKLNGQLAATLPMPVTAALLRHGQDRYGIYCRPCHGGAGDGKGTVALRPIAVAPTSYFEPRLLSVPVGHFFDVITNGVRNMPNLRAQIPAADRWAIAAYVRTLQRSRAATPDQVPPEELAKLARTAP